MKLILALILTLGVAACTKPAESTARAGVDFEVEKLFTYDGCTVYRFYDTGTARYFTNCPGQTTWHESCGKNCSREMNISGQ